VTRGVSFSLLLILLRGKTKRIQIATQTENIEHVFYVILTDAPQFGDGFKREFISVLFLVSLPRLIHILD
jgi:hypothetical protein